MPQGSHPQGAGPSVGVGTGHCGGNSGDGGHDNGGVGRTTQGAGTQKPYVGTRSFTSAVASVRRQIIVVVTTSPALATTMAVTEVFGAEQVTAVPAGAQSVMVFMYQNSPVNVHTAVPEGDVIVMDSVTVMSMVTFANPPEPLIGAIVCAVHATDVTVAAAVLPTGIVPQEAGMEKGWVSVSVWKQKS